MDTVMDVLSTFQRSDEYSMVFSIFSQKVGPQKQKNTHVLKVWLALTSTS